MPNARIVIVMVLLWLVASSRDAAAQPCDTACSDPAVESPAVAPAPPQRTTMSIALTPPFDRTVREMLERSPTFRR